jgi:hypothetical protein
VAKLATTSGTGEESLVLANSCPTGEANSPRAGILLDVSGEDGKEVRVRRRVLTSLYHKKGKGSLEDEGPPGAPQWRGGVPTLKVFGPLSGEPPRLGKATFLWEICCARSGG